MKQMRRDLANAIDPQPPKPPARPMTLQQIGDEARHLLLALRPHWKVGVCVYRGQTYYLGAANSDDFLLDPLRVALPGSGPMTDAVMVSVKQQIEQQIAEREKLAKNRLTH